MHLAQRPGIYTILKTHTTRCLHNKEKMENDRQKMQAEMFRIFGENAVPVFQMTPVKASLEDVFIELTHGSSEPDPEPEDEEVLFGSNLHF